MDLTQPQRRYNLAQSMLGQILQPTRNANAGTGLAKILAAYFATKGMRGAERQESQIKQDYSNQRSMDLASALGAGRGDTAYQMSPDELFPGEAPISGLSNKGTGPFNRMKMAEALMGAKTEGLDELGLKMLASGPSGANKPASVAEYEYLIQLPEEEQQRFMDVKRAPGAKVLDLKDRFRVIDARGNLVGEFAKNIAEATTAEQEAKFQKEAEWKPRIEESIQLARSAAKERGEALTDLGRAEAAMPGILESVNELKELAQIATSTIGGKIWDQAVKQTGFGATEGATARAKFIAIVNNQVLPLLKPTFGAAFTVQEGESLKATMGDPDASPAEKIAQLEAFINQKYRNIQSKKLQVGDEPVNMEGLSDEELRAIISE